MHTEPTSPTHTSDDPIGALHLRPSESVAMAVARLDRDESLALLLGDVREDVRPHVVGACKSACAVSAFATTIPRSGREGPPSPTRVLGALMRDAAEATEERDEHACDILADVADGLLDVPTRTTTLGVAANDATTLARRLVRLGVEPFPASFLATRAINVALDANLDALIVAGRLSPPRSAS